MKNTETTETKSNTATDERWRSCVSECVGGREFDAPGGGYAFSAVLAEERELEKGNKPGDRSSALLKLSVADPTWKMSSTAMDIAREYFDAAWDASRYKDIKGVLATPGSIMVKDTHEMLALLIEGHHKVVTEDGNGLTEAWVQHSPGSIKRALAEYIPTLLFGKGSTLLFPSPSYGVITSPMNTRDAKVIEVPLIRADGWTFDTVEMEEWVLDHRRWRAGALVMYVNIPHNPTGKGFTRTEWEGMLAWADKYDVTLVVDEAYIDLRYRDDIVSVLQVPGWERHCIVLQSVSKGWSATGLRFGWFVAHPTVIKALRKLMDVKDSGMFGPSIAAGFCCLLDPNQAAKTREKYRALHQALANGLRAAGFDACVPDAGLCQFTPAPKAITASPEGIQFKDAADCAKCLRDFLRISVMHAKAAGGEWLRWAVTLRPVPECGIETDEAVIAEVVRRLQSVKFVF